MPESAVNFTGLRNCRDQISFDPCVERGSLARFPPLQQIVILPTTERSCLRRCAGISGSPA
jgi:hypothetical protein